MMDIMPLVQDVEVDLILTDVESQRTSVFYRVDMWIANTGASNDGTAYKKGIMNIRKDESS